MWPFPQLKIVKLSTQIVLTATAQLCISKLALECLELDNSFESQPVLGMKLLLYIKAKAGQLRSQSYFNVQMVLAMTSGEFPPEGKRKEKTLLFAINAGRDC